MNTHSYIISAVFALTRFESLVSNKYKMINMEAIL